MPLWHQAAQREGRWHIDGFGALVRSDIEENLERPATLLASITAVVLSLGNRPSGWTERPGGSSRVLAAPARITALDKPTVVDAG